MIVTEKPLDILLTDRAYLANPLNMCLRKKESQEKNILLYLNFARTNLFSHISFEFGCAKCLVVINRMEDYAI